MDRYGLFCVANRRHPGVVAKRAWLRERFAEGLRFILLLTPDDTPAGFLEYAPAEVTWRAVHAPGYLVIHCLWVNPKKAGGPGGASHLLEHALRDAAGHGFAGLAVVASDGPWMAGPAVYGKYGFAAVDRAEPHFHLLTRKADADAPNPAFPTDWGERRRRWRDLTLLYTNQCPFIGKAVQELPPVAEAHGMTLRLRELNVPSEARALWPSPYGMINLLYRGRVLADHPISATRFRNILEREL